MKTPTPTLAAGIAEQLARIALGHVTREFPNKLDHVLSSATWFNRFLPDVAEGMPATLFLPATVTDRTDGKIAHLDGLNLSRGWCWNRLAARLSKQHALRERAEAAAAAHLSSAMEHVVGDYMGEHWLASFALLALDPVAAG